MMGLRKALTLLDVFCIASGAMISSGLFILPGLAHARVGPAVFISYMLAGFLAATGMLSQAELVSAMPKAGGTYFYVKRTMGPAIGTVDGMITWISMSLKSAFALVGMAAFARYLFEIDIRLVSTAFCLIFVGINIVGIKEAGRTQVVLVAGLLGVLVFYIVRGLPEVDIRHFEPFAPNGVAAIFSTAGFVFISYGGLLKVASVAEEVRKPGRVVPLAMILSLLIVSIFYVLVVIVTTGVLGASDLSGSLTPISDGAAAFSGRAGAVVLGVAAMLAFISTANAGIMAASRYPLALSRDGLLPEHLGRVNDRFKTPHVSLAVTGLIMLAAIFLELEMLVKVASTALILTYLFSCLSIIILRESRLQNYRPVFHSPLYPWVQIVGILGFCLLLFEIGPAAAAASAVIIVSALFVFWFYGRIRSGREFALLHIIERITAKELTTHSLETELKEIIRERDDIVKDRFDRVVEDAIVLDIESHLKASDLFRLVAERMAPRLGMDAERFFDLLVRREEESSTVLTPMLAIPHVVIGGDHTFDIMLVRSKRGVRFSGEMQRVKAVFILAGTADERNFHLRALAAIAQIVQDPHFEHRWLSAKDEEGLRDVVLLGKRRR